MSVRATLRSMVNRRRRDAEIWCSLPGCIFHWYIAIAVGIGRLQEPRANVAHCDCRPCGVDSGFQAGILSNAGFPGKDERPEEPSSPILGTSSMIRQDVLHDLERLR